MVERPGALPEMLKFGTRRDNCTDFYKGVEELRRNVDARLSNQSMEATPLSPLSPSKILIRMIPLDLLECMSPGLVLGSCLVLGCCLSSYVHRRRDQDEHQAIVFVIWIIWAICVGWGIGASANMTTLGIVPWALCAAMFSSFVGHAGARWLSGREKCESRSFTCDIVDEKGTLFKE
ncbi:hypothetical protein AAE478_000297 [Parahypoxylon ruwenzoriense]